jgi:hypothetical protein
MLDDFESLCFLNLLEKTGDAFDSPKLCLAWRELIGSQHGRARAVWISTVQFKMILELLFELVFGF